MKKIIEIYKKYNEVINYLIVGVLTTVICLIVYYICVFTFLNPNIPFELQLANVISWLVAVIFAYVMNRRVVFKSKDKNVTKEAFKFFIARLITLFIDMAFMFGTVTLLKLNDKIMKIISNIIVIILNYIFSKLFIFLKKNS